jgi:type VI protein secretion system component VasF
MFTSQNLNTPILMPQNILAQTELRIKERNLNRQRLMYNGLMLLNLAYFAATFIGISYGLDAISNSQARPHNLVGDVNNQGMTITGKLKIGLAGVGAFAVGFIGCGLTLFGKHQNNVQLEAINRLLNEPQPRI